MKKNVVKVICFLVIFLLMLPVLSVSAAEIPQSGQLDLRAWIKNPVYRDYVEMMVDYHLRNNEMVRNALKGGFSTVFLFDGCSDNMDNPELSDLSYYRVSGVCVVLKLDPSGMPQLLYFSENCSTIPDRPLEYGAWAFPEVGAVGPATVCDGTYQLYSVRHKGQYEALHVRTEYYDMNLDAVYMTPEGYVNQRANEINVHTRTSNHTSGRGMWSAGCPLVGGGKAWEFWKLMDAAYYSIYDTFALDNFVGTLTIDRMLLRTELYTLYENPDAVDMFLSNTRKIQPDTYLRDCVPVQTYEESKTMKASMDTQLMTLPCSNTTDARSRTLTPIPEGDKMEILGRICNTAGNEWYQVAYNGLQGYLYRGHAENLNWAESLWYSLFE